MYKSKQNKKQQNQKKQSPTTGGEGKIYGMEELSEESLDKVNGGAIGHVFVHFSQWTSAHGVPHIG